MLDAGILPRYAEPRDEDLSALADTRGRAFAYCPITETFYVPCLDLRTIEPPGHLLDLRPGEKIPDSIRKEKPLVTPEDRCKLCSRRKPVLHGFCEECVKVMIKALTEDQEQEEKE